MTLGLMTTERWMERFHAGEYIRVQLEGRNITTTCITADDRTGWALILDRGGSQPTYRLVTGRVEFDVRSLQRAPGMPA